MDLPVKVPWGRGAVGEAVDAAAVDEPLSLVEAGTGATFLVRAVPSAPSSVTVPLRIIVAVLPDVLIPLTALTFDCAACMHGMA